MERVLLISGSSKGLDMLVQLIRSAGNYEISALSAGNEARRIINHKEFELIIINAPLSDEFGHELSIDIAEKTSSGVVLICKAEISEDVSDKVGDYGVFVVSKPLNKTLFFQALKLVSAARSRILGIRNENVKLQSKIEEIRLINRAKCTLMQYLKFTEPQAHRYIEKQAMDLRKTKAEVAQTILKTYEL